MEVLWFEFYFVVVYFCDNGLFYFIVWSIILFSLVLVGFCLLFN